MVVAFTRTIVGLLVGQFEISLASNELRRDLTPSSLHDIAGADCAKVKAIETAIAEARSNVNANFARFGSRMLCTRGGHKPDCRCDHCAKIADPLSFALFW